MLEEFEEWILIEVCGCVLLSPNLRQDVSTEDASEDLPHCGVVLHRQFHQRRRSSNYAHRHHSDDR